MGALQAADSKLQRVIFPGAAFKSSDFERAFVRPKYAEDFGSVPQYIETVGEIRPRMLPVKRVPVAGRGRFPRHQVTERRPMVDDPIAGLQDDQAHGSTLVFQYTALADQREQVIANRQRAVVARRCKPQADVRNLPVAMWPLQALPTELPGDAQL